MASWTEADKTADDAPLVTLTLSKRELAALYRSGGSNRYSLQSGSSLWGTLEDAASMYGVASFNGVSIADAITVEDG